MSVTIVDGWLAGSLPDDTGREWPIVQRRQESLRGPLRPSVPNLVMHTTETDHFVNELRFPSNFQTGDAQIGQHIKDGLAGDSLNVWDGFAMQIEMVGRSQVGRWLPPESTLGPTVALVAWLHRTERIKTGLKRPAPWPVVVDQLPAAVESYYRRKAGLWPDTPGVYGHIEIPDNSHWDPGGFDYPRFFARVQRAVEGEDMSTTDMRKGGELFRQGKNLPADANVDMRYGYNLEKRIDAAYKAPKPADHTHPPTPPAAHEHNLQGKAT